jgi:hypothetical protein
LRPFAAFYLISSSVTWDAISLFRIPCESRVSEAFAGAPNLWGQVSNGPDDDQIARSDPKAAGQEARQSLFVFGMD